MLAASGWTKPTYAAALAAGVVVVTVGAEAAAVGK